MQRYFPIYKYERENLPDEFKVMLRQIGLSFENDQIPALKTIDDLIQKSEFL
jgi:hypothetical protein